eukprot:CAMPEP_0197531692 /NCGR_PEP_ID=MMETSP1318-20131121/36637_1 /TAXON_ID=552666 /ORGANISM="Partenskyella glossopodia, Strain RCC365" /LENGTH=314 /DNA_ID=CAMNT_0043087993 /DNA_START=63 /DNA_END=1007 /DNA_ORIENTATION=-
MHKSSPMKTLSRVEAKVTRGSEEGKAKTVPVGYNRRDLVVYALGIGSSDLRFTYEKDPKFAAFPTYPFVLGFKGTSLDVVGFPSKAMRQANVSPVRGPVLDGERNIEIIRPLPAEGRDNMTLTTELIGVHPKRSGTVVETRSILQDVRGDVYAIITSGSFFVGVKDAKKIGQSHSKKIKVPSRIPDKIVRQKLQPQQAMLYRLSGDYNPLHIDPKIAKKAGFPAPILHGLCSLGHSARHVLATYGGNDPSRMKSVCVRFSSPVYPGETLETRMWQESSSSGDVKVIFETAVVERKKVVMSRCQMILGAQHRSKL